MDKPKVILFDVNETLLDLKPVKKAVGEALDDRPELVSLWFTTMLHYSLVMTVADQYKNFDEIAVACLRMVANSHGIDPGEDAAKDAIAPMRSLSAHPDVIPALTRLAGGGYRLLALSNSAQSALVDQLQNDGIDKLLEAALSVEQLRLYKPHSEVYRWAARHAGVDVTECMLVAAHGWDVAGAGWVGMRTAFVARPGQRQFLLGPGADLVVETLTHLAEELEAS